MPFPFAQQLTHATGVHLRTDQARGTSQLEGYHHHLRKVIAATNMSPGLAFKFIAEFNLRWNERMQRRLTGAWCMG